MNSLAHASRSGPHRLDEGPVDQGHVDSRGLVVIRTHLAGRPSDRLESWLIQPVVEVLRRLRALTETSTGRNRQACVVLSVPANKAVFATEGLPAPVAVVEAVVEAMRGIVQAITAEINPQVLRVNLVIAAGDGRTNAVDDAIDFLAGAGGGFAAGSTFDLRGRR
jgi:hypothetical protein